VGCGDGLDGVDGAGAGLGYDIDSTRLSLEWWCLDREPILDSNS